MTTLNETRYRAARTIMASRSGFLTTAEAASAGRRNSADDRGAFCRHCPHGHETGIGRLLLRARVYGRPARTGSRVAMAVRDLDGGGAPRVHRVTAVPRGWERPGAPP